jgi:ABC-2 type transport system permease protein
MSRAARQARRAERRAARQIHLRKGENLRASSSWAHVVQALAFVRKELVEVLRQPRLLILLVAGPFIVLLLFGAGYRDTDLAMRTEFVGPRGSVYEDAVSDYADVLADYIEPAGFTDDEAAARRRLDNGDIDVVVVFPTDPLAAINAGSSAEIVILHEELDPFQQAAIEIAARLAVQEVNASVLGVVVGSAQTALQPASELAATLAENASTLSSGDRDDEQIAEAAASAVPALVSTRALVAGAQSVFERLGATEQAADLSDSVVRIESALGEATSIASGDPELAGRSDELSATMQSLADELPTLTTIDPAVLVRPFESRTENLLPVRIDPTDYFAPSSVVLLLQHLAVTFAALSLVRDRELGLFELLRVGPLSPAEILLGKTIAYLLIGSFVGAVLVAAAVYGLDVPFQGEVGWAAATVLLVLLASLALGTVLSLISKTETQAVQFAMLSLLVGMFFSGFILDVDGLAEPYRYVSYLVPATYGINVMQDVMLRGEPPQSADLIGLGALALAYGVVAVLMLRRRLRTA